MQNGAKLMGNYFDWHNLYGFPEPHPIRLCSQVRYLFQERLLQSEMNFQMRIV